MSGYNFIGLGETREQYLGLLRKEKTEKDNSARIALMKDLRNAAKLGNAYRETVEIHYFDKHRLIIKDVLVLSTTERFVILKGGIAIPIDTVKRVVV